MRWGTYLVALFSLSFAFGRDRLVAFSIGTNTVELPATTKAVWIAPSDASGVTLKVLQSTDGKRQFVVPPQKAPIHDGRGGIINDAEWPRTRTAFFACRTLVDGRWSSIETVAGVGSGGEWSDLRERLTITDVVNQPSGVRFRFFVRGVQQGDVRLLKSREGLFFERVHRRDKKKWPHSPVCYPLMFEVIANRIGSTLDPVLRVLDAKGDEVDRCDDSGADRDPQMIFIPPHEGEYFLELRDVANGSGPDFFYVLRAQQAEWGGDYIRQLRWASDYAPWPVPTVYGRYLAATNSSSASALKLEAPFVVNGFFKKPGQPEWFEFPSRSEQKLIMSVETRRFGSACDARLALFDDQDKLMNESVGVEANGPALTNRFTKAGLHRLRVTEISKLLGCYWLRVEEAKPGVLLTTDVERVDFSKAGELKIKIACKRYDYDEAVKLDVEGLPEGVSVSDGVIAKGKNETELKFKREKEVEGFQIRINGSIEGKETEGNKFPVSTMPALRKLYPLQMFPCAAMDGWIAVNPAAP